MELFLLAEGEELGSNLLRVLYRRPAELGGLGKVARAAPALPRVQKAAKRPFFPGAALSGQNPCWRPQQAMATATFR